MVRYFFVFLMMVCTTFSREALAHHGKDFLIVESYELPHTGDVYAVTTAAYSHAQAAESLEVEPGILAGIAPWLSAELHAHFVKMDGRTLEYEALAPSLHYQVTDHPAETPIRVALSAEYELGQGDEADRFEGRLILEKTLGRARFVFNLIGEYTTETGTDYGYAAGLRHELNETMAVGVEAQGPFKNDVPHEWMAGVYVEPVEALTLKAGVGTGVGPDSADFTTRAGLVFAF